MIGEVLAAGPRRADRRRPRPACASSDVEQGRARCTVVVGGEVTAHKGVNLPGVPIPIPSLTRKDIDDLEFALGLGVDFVALSFVRSAADVRDLQELHRRSTARTARVIAKIEKAEAVDALDDDPRTRPTRVMVARGDLGVEIGAATVPLCRSGSSCARSSAGSR